MRPEAFLFDIGKVIIHFDFSKTVAAIGDRCNNMPVEEILGSVTDLTQELEIGKIQPQEFVERVTDRVGFTGQPEELIGAFEDVFELNQPMVDFIEARHREDFPLYLLSNTNGIHVPFFSREYEVFSLFSGAVYSHEVGLMKPDPAIFQIAIENFSLNPEKTVYTDDLAGNCQTARKVGFQTIEYCREHHTDFLEQIDSFFA